MSTSQTSLRPVVRCALWLAALAAMLVPASSFALQPLAEFIRAARENSPDSAEATAGLQAQQAQADLNLGRALPGVSARGVYTRNQYQFGIGPPFFPETVYLLRYNQFDAFFTLNVPLVDLASFQRIASARSGSEAAEQQVKGAILQVSAVVVQDYFQLIANQALVAASEKALGVAQSNLHLTQTRFDAGRAAALEVDRAKADVERQVQQLAGARLQVALMARALESASSVTPDLSGDSRLGDDLHEEAALETFEGPDSELPSIAAAMSNRVSAEEQARSQRFSLIPSLAGQVVEHGTNAASFVGQPWSYSATLSLNWQLDYTTFAAIRAQDAGLAAARAREARARLQARDAIHRDWETIGSAIARSRSARAEQEASQHASQLAQDRYEAGAATQLDLLQAQRDAFSADVARIQADADLVNARLQLRLAAGIDPFTPKGTP